MPEQTVQEQASIDSSSTKKNSKWISTVLIVIAVVILIIITGLCAYLFGKRAAEGETDVTETTTVTTTVSEGEEESDNTTTTTTTTTVAVEEEVSIKVFFSKNPSSFDDPTIRVGVDRTTTRSDVATFAIEQLIAGPTEDEQVGGLFSPLSLTGDSNCSGKDFSINIDQTTKKATITFCKQISVSGTVDTAQVTTTVEDTLTEFTTIDSVAILTHEDHCFGDESGMNLCKEG